MPCERLSEFLRFCESWNWSLVSTIQIEVNCAFTYFSLDQKRREIMTLEFGTDVALARTPSAITRAHRRAWLTGSAQMKATTTRPHNAILVRERQS
jgi:hypothetical protein